MHLDIALCDYCAGGVIPRGWNDNACLQDGKQETVASYCAVQNVYIV